MTLRPLAKLKPQKHHLYLDCDQVLADFDKKAWQLFMMHPRQFEDTYGREAFWNTIRTTPEFFTELEMMEDAHILYSAVKHLNPTILTGVPDLEFWAVEQKQRWAAKMFGTDQRIICCRSRHKSLFCKPGDILVDDWPKYRYLWERTGGTFVLHTSAQQSLEKLKELGVL